MGLTEDALAARAEALSQRQEAARTVLGTRLSPADVDELDVAATTDSCVVFTDGTLHLAVRDSSDPTAVFLVEADNAGGWTRLAPVPTLTALGLILAAEDDA